MMHDSITLQGAPTFTLVDNVGKVKAEFTIPNMVVSTGKAYFVSRAVGLPDVMSHMAVGSGTTAVVAANTSLQTETARVSLTSAAASSNTATFSATFPPGVATGPITEAGIFNAASAGTMMSRTVFAVFNKDVADTLYVSWAITAT